MEPTRWRKKPVVIEASDPIDADNAADIAAWCGGQAIIDQWDDHGPLGSVEIRTLEGTMRGDHGDRVLRGVQGEFYPCKPDIFDATYEPAGQPDTGSWDVGL